jgi:hypothetical protein
MARVVCFHISRNTKTGFSYSPDLITAVWGHMIAGHYFDRPGGRNGGVTRPQAHPRHAPCPNIDHKPRPGGIQGRGSRTVDAGGRLHRGMRLKTPLFGVGVERARKGVERGAHALSPQWGALQEPTFHHLSAWWSCDGLSPAPPARGNGARLFLPVFLQRAGVTNSLHEPWAVYGSLVRDTRTWGTPADGDTPPGAHVFLEPPCAGYRNFTRLCTVASCV